MSQLPKFGGVEMCLRSLACQLSLTRCCGFEWPARLLTQRAAQLTQVVGPDQGAQCEPELLFLTPFLLGQSMCLS